ncbi:MAG: zinc-finger domain-containing protein [Burkholderiales bacterium]
MNQVKRHPPVVEVTEHDLPLHCPTPSMSLWSEHPRVFLDVGQAGEVQCPYCGTRYVYKGEKPKGH